MIWQLILHVKESSSRARRDLSEKNLISCETKAPNPPSLTLRPHLLCCRQASTGKEKEHDGKLRPWLQQLSQMHMHRQCIVLCLTLATSCLHLAMTVLLTVLVSSWNLGLLQLPNVAPSIGLILCDYQSTSFGQLLRNAIMSTMLLRLCVVCNITTEIRTHI